MTRLATYILADGIQNRIIVESISKANRSHLERVLREYEPCRDRLPVIMRVERNQGKPGDPERHELTNSECLHSDEEAQKSEEATHKPRSQKYGRTEHK